MTHFKIYSVGDRVLIPLSAKTQSGIWLETQPVGLADRHHPQEVIRKIKEALAGGHPIIPTPPLRGWPKPVVVAAAGLRTWENFLLAARGWSVEKRGGAYALVPLCVAASGDHFTFDSGRVPGVEHSDRLHQAWTQGNGADPRAPQTTATRRRPTRPARPSTSRTRG
jgi:hypothetical protein